MREQIKRDVWVPVTHPLSGKRVNVRSISTERLLTQDEIAELEAHLAVDSARDTPDDYYGGNDG